MAVISLKNKIKRGNLLVGNDYYIPPSFESIATVTTTGSESSVTFSSIPSTYKHLQIRTSILGSDGDTINLRFNSDNSFIYAFHRLSGTGTSATAGNEYLAINFIPICDATYQGMNPTYPTPSITDIYDYTSTSKYKTTKTISGIDKNGTGAIQISSGLWRNTAAISSIQIATFASNYSANCTFALYGIKGA